MLKKALVGVSAVAILLLVAVSYLTARYTNWNEVRRAEREAMQLAKTRDSILAVVHIRDSLEGVYAGRVDRLLNQTDTLRQEVARLEKARQDDQLSIRKLRRSEDLQRKFVETFPELAGSDWGVKDVFSERGGIDIEYLLVPSRFAETFIIDHQNSRSFEQQRDTMIRVDSLNRQVIVLKDSVLTLERQNRAAFQTGYDSAFAKYQDLNGRYVDLLKKPPHVTLGAPHWALLLGAGVVGGLVGTQF